MMQLRLRKQVVLHVGQQVQAEGHCDMHLEEVSCCIWQHVPTCFESFDGPLRVACHLPLAPQSWVSASTSEQQCKNETPQLVSVEEMLNRSAAQKLECHLVQLR